MLEVSLLGSLTIYYNDQLINHRLTAKAQALLCYLMVEPRPHDRRTLAGLLWGEDTEEKARNSLRVALSSLRKTLPAYFEVTRLTIHFAPAEPYQLDLEQFEQQTHSLDDLNALYQAFLLYRDGFLTDFYVENASAFEDWQRHQQAHWQQRFLQIAQVLAHHRLATLAYDEASPILQRILEIEPWQEAAHRHLMMAYSRLGAFNAALAQYKKCQTILHQELGITPMPETRQLYEQIRMARMAPLYQPPVTATPFFGREEELHHIHTLLIESDCRLLTLVGLGGAGKTRLAQAMAQSLSQTGLRHFLHGIVFVSLAGVDSIDMLPVEITKVLKLELRGQAPLLEQLLHYLEKRELLIILDNFEQLVEEALYLNTLLTHCPRLKLLVTSREPLYLQIEWQLDVQGLAYPPHHRLPQWDNFAAIRLFTQTITQLSLDPTQVWAEARAVTQLCRLVAGMPLALKMAAAWLRQMTMPEIVTQVKHNLDILRANWRDVPPRQRSIRAVLDHTWAMLPPETREVATALAVFRGGFTLTAAHTVTQADETILTQLQHWGLLSQGDHKRYEMHEMVRQYALEQLLPETLDAYQQKHAIYYSQDVQQQYPHFYGPHHQTTVDALTSENDNQRAAWRWLIQQIEEEKHTPLLLTLLPQIIPGLTILYESSALYQLGHQSFSQVVTVMTQAGWATTTPLPQTLLAQAQVSAAIFHYTLGYYDQAETLIQAAQPTLTANRAYQLLSLALLTLGKINIRRGQNEVAQHQVEECITYARQAHDKYIEADATNALGNIASNIGAYEAALQHLHHCLALYQEQGYVNGTSMILCNIGSTHVRAGDVTTGIPYYEQALTLAETHNNTMTVLVTTSNMGDGYRRTGRFEKAVAFYERGLTIARDLAHQRWIVATLNGLGKTYMESDQLSAAYSCFHEALTLGHHNEMVPDMMNTVAGLGHVRAKQGYPEEGLRLLLFAQKHPATIAVNKAYMVPLLAELRQELPAPLMAAAAEWADTVTLPELIDWVHAVFT